MCRDNNYEDIDELSKLIKTDWKSALEPHTGLSNYYIPSSIFQIQKSMNAAISDQIFVITKLIDEE